MAEVNSMIEQMWRMERTLPPADFAAMIHDVQVVFDPSEVPSHPDEVGPHEIAKLFESVTQMAQIIHRWSVSTALANDPEFLRQVEETSTPDGVSVGAGEVRSALTAA